MFQPGASDNPWEKNSENQTELTHYEHDALVVENFAKCHFFSSLSSASDYFAGLIFLLEIKPGPQFDDGHHSQNDKKVPSDGVLHKKILLKPTENNQAPRQNR